MDLANGVPPSSDYAQFKRSGGFLPDLPQRNSNNHNFSNKRRVILDHKSGYKPPSRDISHPQDPLWNQRLNYDESRRQYESTAAKSNQPI